MTETHRSEALGLRAGSDRHVSSEQVAQDGDLPRHADEGSCWRNCHENTIPSPPLKTHSFVGKLRYSRRECVRGRAGGQAGRRAGGQAGRRAGGQAGGCVCVCGVGSNGTENHVHLSMGLWVGWPGCPRQRLCAFYHRRAEHRKPLA